MSKPANGECKKRHMETSYWRSSSYALREKTLKFQTGMQTNTSRLKPWVAEKEAPPPSAQKVLAWRNALKLDVASLDLTAISTTMKRSIPESPHLGFKTFLMRNFAYAIK